MEPAAGRDVGPEGRRQVDRQRRLRALRHGHHTALVDAGSAGGRQASFSWFYQGPPVNTGGGPYLTADQALPILWNWFFANGGTDRTTRTTPNIPGLSTKVSGDVMSPSTNELSLGIANVAGHVEWRVDYLHRAAKDQVPAISSTCRPARSPMRAGVRSISRW